MPTDRSRPLTPAQLAGRRLRIPTHPAAPIDRPPFPANPRTRRRRLRRPPAHRLEDVDNAASKPARMRFSPTPRPAPPPRPVPPLHTPHGGAEPLFIFTPEGRSAYADLTYPWRCVAKVINLDKKTGVWSVTGSGALIGPRHVLTASHCVVWDTDDPILVLLQSGIDLTLGAALAVDAYTYTPIADNDEATLDEDYAVLVLDRRLGDEFGWLGTRTYDSSWDEEVLPWVSISYAPSIGGEFDPVVQVGFALDEWFNDFGPARELASYDSDVEHGMSGSPVFGMWDVGPRVVAVAAAQVTGTGLLGEDYNAYAAGTLLGSLVKEVRALAP